MFEKGLGEFPLRNNLKKKNEREKIRICSKHMANYDFNFKLFFCLFLYQGSALIHSQSPSTVRLLLRRKFLQEFCRHDAMEGQSTPTGSSRMGRTQLTE